MEGSGFGKKHRKNVSHPDQVVFAVTSRDEFLTISTFLHFFKLPSFLSTKGLLSQLEVQKMYLYQTTKFSAY
jgi:hypothetical protein